MKKFVLLPLAAMVALAACNESATLLAPEGPQFELVDPDLRVDATQVNAWVRGSFTIPVVVEVAGGDPVLVPNVLGRDAIEPANFPGAPKAGPGTCDKGLWINPKDKPTSGSIDNPHPHCVDGYTEEGGTTYETIYVELEPISARYTRDGMSQNFNLELTSEPGATGRAKIKTNDDLIEAQGNIAAYAVLASDPTQRVGIIRFDLGDYDGEFSSLFDCTMSGDIDADNCLKKNITFDYEPLDAEDGGIGSAVLGTAGFLWWVNVVEGTTYRYE